MRTSINTINKAHSFNNGIIFYSNHNPEYGTMVTIDEFQNIKTEYLSKRAAEKEEERLTAQYKEKEDALLNKILIFMFIPQILVFFSISLM